MTTRAALRGCGAAAARVLHDPVRGVHAGVDLAARAKKKAAALRSDGVEVELVATETLEEMSQGDWEGKPRDECYNEEVP